jgi:hypothetical protein
MSKVGLSILVMLMVLYSACIVAPGSKSNKSLVISSLEAKYASVYSKGASEIVCVVSAPEGDTVQLKWSSTGGSIIGEGSTVTWQAPDDYGDYHIMVIAKDNNGGSDEAALTVSVVPRPPYKSCCGR